MGVICEYNPFHEGHKYQLKIHKNEFSADGVVCLMSGNFVQRGAPAIFDKWTRAKQAVEGGADLVLELPTVYATQSAMRFAKGAVHLMDSLGVIDFLSFGSECGNIQQLADASAIIFSEEFSFHVARESKNGVSFPKARSNALKKFYPDIDATIIETPNNILALEYLNALKIIDSKILPVTIKRNDKFLPASEIRSKIESGEIKTQNMPIDKNIFDSIVSYRFRQETGKNLEKIADMSEGLHNRFLKYVKTTYGAEDLAEHVKSKRYTRTRINRIIINTLLGITNKDTSLSPQYARVLAFNERGTEILKEMSKRSKVPIITKMADAKPSNPDFHRMLEIDILATDIYALLTENKQAGLDFKTSPYALL